MKNIPEYSLILIISLTVLFHLLILAGVFPYDIVWGSRLQHQRQMVVFEAISIIANLFFLFVILMKARLIRPILSEKILNVFLWIMFGMFTLNTIGNIFSESGQERLIFTPVTLLLAVLVFLMIRKRS